MWFYDQSTGQLTSPTGEKLWGGYSGAGAGKNNPQWEDIRDTGPLPRGGYEICSPRDTTTHGPFVLPLLPDEDNEMFGRSGFLIHGDSLVHPGAASCGCIILPLAIRTSIWGSGDRQLEVT